MILSYWDLVKEINARPSSQEKVDYILNLSDEQIEVKTKAGLNLFHAFTNTSDLDLLSALLSRGLDINNHSTWDGKTLLFKIEQPATVEWLLKNGAHVNHQDQDGMTPISHHLENDVLLDLFLKYKADATIRTNYDHSLLKSIIINVVDAKIVSKLEILHRHGVDLEEVDAIGLSTMHFAVQYQKGRAVEYLLNSDFNFEAKTIQDYSLKKGEDFLILPQNSSPMDLIEKLVEWVGQAKDSVGGEWVEEQKLEIYTCYYILKENLIFNEAYSKAEQKME